MGAGGVRASSRQKETTRIARGTRGYRRKKKRRDCVPVGVFTSPVFEDGSDTGNTYWVKSWLG